MARVDRFDRGELTREPYLTSEGFLFVEGVATRCGVFSYPQPDGSTILELRADADVLDPESLATLGRKPVTLDHPTVNGKRVLVTPDNYQEFGAGSVGERVSAAGGYVEVSLSVQRADALEAVQSGRARELSCAYTCDIDATPGDHPQYGRYDQRQINIVYNHLAVVPQGRAGDEARLRMDSVGQITTKPLEATEQNMLKKITIRGLDYEMPVEVANAVQALRADMMEEMPKADEMPDMGARMDEMGGRYDAMCARMDAMDKGMEMLMDLVSKLADEGLIPEIEIEAMAPELRGDAIDMTPEAKAARQILRDAQALAEFKHRSSLVSAAKTLRVDGSDDLTTSALEVKVASAYLGRELRADEQTPGYLRGVLATAVVEAEKTATRNFGAGLGSQRAETRTDAADSLEKARNGYAARVSGKTA
jgi:hypothetical protein